MSCEGPREGIEEGVGTPPTSITSCRPFVEVERKTYVFFEFARIIGTGPSYDTVSFFFNGFRFTIPFVLSYLFDKQMVLLFRYTQLESDSTLTRGLE